MDFSLNAFIYYFISQNIFTRMIYLIFCVNRDLENKEIDLKLEIYSMKKDKLETEVEV